MVQRPAIPKQPPTFVFKAIQKVRNALSRVRRALVPADAAILEIIANKWVGHAVYAAAALEIPDAFTDEMMTVAELARRTDTDEDALYRLMRLLASQGIFKEVRNRTFALTPMARALRSGQGSIRNMVMFQFAPYFQRAWFDIARCVKTGEPALERTLGQPVFEFFKEHPEEAAYFDTAMYNDCFQSAAAVVAAHDFSEAGTVVDFGGGLGVLLACILAKFPSTRGVLLDLPHVVAHAAPVFETFGVSDRVEIVGGDFFESVPRGDTYIGRNIVHSFDDEPCVRILSNIHRAMNPEGALLIVDTIIAEDNGPSFGKLLDVNMLVASGGRERTEREHEGLLNRTGFRIERVTHIFSPYSIIVARRS